MQSLRKLITLRCVFCHSTEFAMPWKGYAPPPGSYVVCANCGKENDVTSMLITVKAEGLSIAKDHAMALAKELTNELKKSFKNSKFIKLK